MAEGSVTTLYRFYDAGDRLLYVGITERGPQRWKEHRKGKDWWPEVVRTTTTHYPTRPAAEEAERCAIVTEHPLHNVVHNAVRGLPAKAPRRHEIDWECKYCRQHIADGDGYLWSNRDHYWIPTHRSCDEDIDITGYWIPIERLRTISEFEDWVDHLGRKRWFDGGLYEALNMFTSLGEAS